MKEVPMNLLSTGEGRLFRDEEEVPTEDTYVHARQTFKAKAFAPKKPIRQFSVPSGDGPGYDVGDRVRHTKFGDGIVTAMTAGGRDYEVTVNFDTAGTKKMFAVFAKLQKVPE